MRSKYALSVCLALIVSTTALGQAPLGRNRIRLEVPPQFVEIGDTRAAFAARVDLCENGVADGGLFLQWPDEEPLALRAIRGQVGRGGVIRFILIDSYAIRGEVQPGDFVVLTVEPVLEEDACLIWDLVGPDVEGGPTSGVRFEAETRVAVRPGGNCRPAPVGQPAVEASIVSPRQVVQPRQTEDPIGFAADLVIDPDNFAEGGVTLAFPDGPLCADVFFGAVLGTREDPVVFLVGVVPDTGLIVLGTVAPTDDPGVQNWELDLAHWSIDNVRYTFSAEGQLTLRERD